MPQTARLNQTVSWVCSGSSDTLTCPDVSPIRDGLQVEAGFNLTTATITATLPSGVTKVVTAPAGTENSGLLGEGFIMSQLVITGVTAGTYTVRFSQ